MKDLKTLERRLTRLQQTAGNNTVRFEMPDKSYRFMRKQTLFETFADSVVGITTPETAIMLASTADNSGTKLAALLKAICG